MDCVCIYTHAFYIFCCKRFYCEFLIYNRPSYLVLIMYEHILSFSLSLSPLHLSSTSSPSCTPVLVQSKAKEMSGVSSISLGNCDSVFSSVRLNHLPLEEQWGGPYPGPKSNLNPQRLLKLLQAISIQTHVKSTQTVLLFLLFLGL